MEDQFKELREYWYGILKDSGFKDIERMANDDFVLINSAAGCYRHNGDDLLRMAKESYFRILTHITADDSTDYRSNVDKYIMVRHAEGASIKEIVDELARDGQRRDRKTVGSTIKRYERLWGIR